MKPQMRVTRRNVGLATALRYRGQGPMLTFILHRISGLGMAVFITVHILSSIGGKTGIYLNGLYESWVFQVVIFFCVLFHIINGLRITIFDLWPSLLAHEREAIWLEWPVFLALYGVSVLVIVRAGLGS
jgi:succinate dehydrogenase / fumarate reductase cytochrome b subunit